MQKKSIMGTSIGVLFILGVVALIIIKFSISKILVIAQDRTTAQKFGSQENLDNFVEQEKRKVDEAMDRIDSASGDLSADYRVVASSEFASREDKELVHKRLAELLKSSDKEIVRASIESLSFYISTNVMQELISLGTSSEQFYVDVVKSLSFNPYAKASDYRRTRKKDNLKEIAEDKNISEKSRLLAKEAFSKLN